MPSTFEIAVGVGVGVYALYEFNKIMSVYMDSETKESLAELIHDRVKEIVHSMGPRTHDIFRNPILVIRRDEDFRWVTKMLNKQLNSAQHTYLGFTCRRVEVRNAYTFTELQLASPNGICVVFVLKTTAMPQELRDLLRKTTIVGVNSVVGAKYLEDHFGAEIRNVIDLRCFGEFQPTVTPKRLAVIVKNELNLDLNCTFCNITDEYYSEDQIQCATSNSIGAAKTMESYLRRGIPYTMLLETNHLRPEFHGFDAFQSQFNYSIYVVTDQDYHCPWVIDQLRKGADSCCDFPFLGIDYVWHNGRVALVQIANSSGMCALFRIPALKFPSYLESLLTDKFPLKVGVDPFRFVRQVSSLINFDEHTDGMVDLRHFRPTQPNGLAILAQQILNVKLDTENPIKFSAWDQPDLTDAQMQYAAGGAIAAVKLFEAICSEKDKDQLEAIFGKEYRKYEYQCQ